MSADKQVTVKVHILDREYQVACPEDGREALLDSARYVNERMRAIRNRGRALGVERIAVMTSLNMARELLDYQRGQQSAELDRGTEARLERLVERIDAALNDTEPLI